MSEFIVYASTANQNLEKLTNERLSIKTHAMAIDLLTFFHKQLQQRNSKNQFQFRYAMHFIKFLQNIQLRMNKIINVFLLFVSYGIGQ